MKIIFYFRDELHKLRFEYFYFFEYSQDFLKGGKQISDLQKSCRGGTEFLYTLHLAYTNVSILHGTC